MGKTYTVSFRVTREEDHLLRAKALTEKQTLAAYAKAKVLSEEKPLDRPTIEAEIDCLKHTLEKCFGNYNQRIDQFQKSLIFFSVLNRELMLKILDRATDDAEWVRNTYQKAFEAAKKEMMMAK